MNGTFDWSGTRREMLRELTRSFTEVREEQLDGLAKEIAGAKRIFFYGLGRERTMLLAFAMRLMHLGLRVHVVGDVTTPAIGAGDLWITSSGTGHLATVEALMGIAKPAGARVVFFTAFPDAPLPRQADLVVHIPAQTMREGGDAERSIQPMGSLFEQTQLLLFDLCVIRLMDLLRPAPEEMEKRHTNLE
ncbi:hexulose-6-phosphate isomerase [Cohnella xylanilytica]|uniref:SIS domain-containing protein n=1 Tax=Cohnella xylanilytica TaxID=557555 RepID=A0A841TQ57_9BACL|nr:6-phospho-3-hexuloisomerase [Cohnella xylanilytica]MBB6690285.1 SIS domain-containing protein [Cohnella xylanilytica]GIO11562.1 hexulose-6-phosphate isomerase [Cohnella xylanilytica]